MEVVIGQTLYELSPRPGHRCREHTVLSIGRKWIQLSGGARCDKDLGLDCGGYGTRQLFTSIEQYEKERRLDCAWRDLCRDLSRAKRPEGMTVEEINAIRTKLGLEVLDVSGS